MASSLSAVLPDRFKSAARDTPGPGDYEAPDGAAEGGKARTFSSAFNSGSRRSLPWGGAGLKSPRSVQSRAAEQEPDAESPGPGTYDSGPGGPRRPGARVKGAFFGQTTLPRFGPEPSRPTGPSPQHYFPTKA